MRRRIESGGWTSARAAAAALCAVALIMLVLSTVTHRKGDALEERLCRAELRSWVVAGRGRHLYLDLRAPEGFEALSGRVEFTTVMLREDYRYTLDESGAPRVGRMRGGVLRPPSFAGPPDNRLEGVFEVSVERARCLQRDRVFGAPYVLVGTNSNSALRSVMQGCGLVVPDHVLRGGGVLGEFPGVDSDVGDEIDSASWPRFGVTSGGPAATAPASPPRS